MYGYEARCALACSSALFKLTTELIIASVCYLCSISVCGRTPLSVVAKLPRLAGSAECADCREPESSAPITWYTQSASTSRLAPRRRQSQSPVCGVRCACVCHLSTWVLGESACGTYDGREPRLRRGVAARARAAAGGGGAGRAADCASARLPLVRAPLPRARAQGHRALARRLLQPAGRYFVVGGGGPQQLHDMALLGAVRVRRALRRARRRAGARRAGCACAAARPRRAPTPRVARAPLLLQPAAAALAAALR